MQATAKDLRFHAKELLESVERGEEVIITYRGKPHAKLIAIEKSVSTLSGNKLFGIWKDKTDTMDVSKYVTDLRKGRF